MDLQKFVERVSKQNTKSVETKSLRALVPDAERALERAERERRARLREQEAEEFRSLTRRVRRACSC